MANHSYPRAETSMVSFGNRVEGFVAVPVKGKSPFPAVVLGHERYGLVKHTLDLAAKFARDGYVCVAPDLFSRWDGDKAALNRGEIMHQLADDEIRFCMSAGVGYLLQHPKSRSKKMLSRMNRLWFLDGRFDSHRSARCGSPNTAARPIGTAFVIRVT